MITNEATSDTWHITNDGDPFGFQMFPRSESAVRIDVSVSRNRYAIKHTSIATPVVIQWPHNKALLLAWRLQNIFALNFEYILVQNERQ